MKAVGDSPLDDWPSILHPQGMYQTLLVPFDGSAPSARSLPLAVAIARHTGAAVRVAIVHDPSAYIRFVPGEVAVPTFDEGTITAHREHDQHLLDATVERLRGLGLNASGALLEGTTVEALVEHAQQIGADLTIMGTHGRSGFERLRLGSIATAYLTRSTTPVLLVPHAAEHDAEIRPGSALLCPLDGSPFSEAMLPHARVFSEALGLRMHLIGVAVPHAIPMAPFGAEALLADNEALKAETWGREEYLAKVAAQCPPGTTWAALNDMSVARAVEDAARDLDAGAIAMATHGRGGFKRLLLGSVTDEVLRSTPIPTLVYRQQS